MSDQIFSLWNDDICHEDLPLKIWLISIVLINQIITRLERNLHRQSTVTPFSWDSLASSIVLSASLDWVGFTSSSAWPLIAAATFSYSPTHRPGRLGYLPEYFPEGSSKTWTLVSKGVSVVKIPCTLSGSTPNPGSRGLTPFAICSSWTQVLRCCVCNTFELGFHGSSSRAKAYLDIGALSSTDNIFNLLFQRCGYRSLDCDEQILLRTIVLEDDRERILHIATVVYLGTVETCHRLRSAEEN